MNDFIAMFKSDFLLHNALWGSVVVGLFCPLIGVYFMLRRMVLLGVALPQISAAGVAFAFFLQGFGVQWSLHAGEANDRFLALIGSSVFTILTILVLAWLERRGEGTTDSRIGAAYAIAYAASILFVASNANGKIEMLNLLHGEIVSVTSHDLHVLTTVYVLLTVLLILLNRQFILVSFDRQSATVMGKNVIVWDALLYAMIGLAISIGVIIVGPMLTFTFLIVPPLAVRRFCHRMSTFFVSSAMVGGACGLIGFYVSYHLDWPLGPTDIGVAGMVLVAAVALKKMLDLFSRERGFERG